MYACVFVCVGLIQYEHVYSYFCVLYVHSVRADRRAVAAAASASLSARHATRVYVYLSVCVCVFF